MQKIEIKQYNKTEWIANKTLVAAEKLNKIEDQLKTLTDKSIEFNSQIDTIESKDIPRIYNYNNKFITDYKGVCVRSWVNGSLYTLRFREELISLLNEVGANSVALTINTYQSDINSNNPFARVPINLKEIEDYILFLKSNNIRILFKHHVEIDTSNYQWRANINPSDKDTWFENYKIGIIEYAKLCEKHKIESFSVGSEYRYLTQTYPSKWIEIIEEVRKVYNGLITYGANLNNDERDEVNTITFWDKLDFVGIDFYVYGIDSGSYNDHLRSFYHTKNHKNVNVMLDTIAKTTNKPILFTEYGLNSDTNTVNRNNYIKAVHDLFLNKKYSLGGFIWVYEIDTTNWFENDTDLKDIFKERNIRNKQIENDGFLMTQKSNTDSSNYSLFCRYKLDKIWADASCDFYFVYRGLTSYPKEMYANLKIRISIKDDVNNPNIQYEIIDGNINTSNLIYKISGGYVNFYVKVSNYSQIFYKLKDSPDIGLFEVLEYQPLEDIESPISSSHKQLLNDKDGNITVSLVDNVKLATGNITGTMSNGIIDKTITLPVTISQCFGVPVNVNYISGGNSYDVNVNGQYIGNNKIKISGKHLTIQGNYSYELSYIVVYK